MYELVYIVRPTVEEQTLAAVNEKVARFINSGGGAVTHRDDWGKRHLAYPVLRFTEGFYTVLQFNLPSAAVRDLERSLQLTEEILRYLVVRVDEAASLEVDSPRVLRGGTSATSRSKEASKSA